MLNLSPKLLAGASAVRRLFEGCEEVDVYAGAKVISGAGKDDCVDVRVLVE